MSKGIATIIATIILVVITIGLVSTAYLYFSGLISGATRGTIQLLDAYCDDANDDIYVIVQNKGTSTITELTWKIDGADATLNDDTCDDSILPDGVANCEITDPTTSGLYEILVIGPANSVGGSVQCR